MKTLYLFKQLIFSISFPISILLLIKLTYSYSCYFLLIPIFITLFLTYSFFQKRMREKHCFKNCYFKDNTFLANIVISPYLTFIFYILLSCIYTITIIYSVLSFKWYFYIFLVIFIIFLFFLYNKLSSLFSNIVKEEYLDIFIKEITIKISSFILFIIFLFYTLNSFEPSYLSNNLEESLQLATNTLASNCQYLDFILRLKIELDTYFWYFTKYGSQIIDNSYLKTTIWILFIFINTLSIIGINRFFVQIISFSKKIKE
ncbi:putative membrane protein [Aliarcobacter lanthieri]|nr:putative membrane protein [Aliarcobacter lanthieri]